MKRSLIALVWCCLSAAIVCAMGADPANFSGTWVLDKAKSEGLPANIDSYSLIVTQDGKQIVAETKIVREGQDAPSQPSTYKLDGSESTMELTGRAPGKATLKAKWLGDGKILELAQVRNVNFQGNDVTINVKEHWELAEGGKVLKLHRTTESPRGTQEVKLTFNKK